MNSLCISVREQMETNFFNLETALRTYDRNALICGAPAWRYVYHLLHSCDKWFINPSDYKEPPFHEDGMNNPDNPCKITLSDEQLLDYLKAVESKVNAYLDELTDDLLYLKPQGCEYTRFELILGQFRHFNSHVGMLNGITIANTGKFPVFVGLDREKIPELKAAGTIFDE